MTLLELQEVVDINAEFLEALSELRAVAWATELPPGEAMTDRLDEFDRRGRHWVVLQQGRMVAAARLTVHRDIPDVPYAQDFEGVFTRPVPPPIASLNRLVVSPAVRRQGLSRRLDVARLEAALQAGCRCAVVAVISGEHRIRTLERLGFAVAGTGPRIEVTPWRALPPPVVLLRMFGCADNSRGLAEPLYGL
jgi:GNAT superfamily N-acetyltransferase